MKQLLFLMFAAVAACSAASAEEKLCSPDGKIEVSLRTDERNISYSVSLNGDAIISSSILGLKLDAAAALEIVEVTRSSRDAQWESIWGIHKKRHDRYNEIQLQVGGASAQTIIFRVYNDGVAFRYQIPETGKFSDKAYAHETSEVSFISENPTAWFPLTQVLVSDAVDLNTWESPKKGGGKDQ